MLIRFFRRPAVLVFALSLGVGVGVVAWRAAWRAETARAAARSEARARCASLELHLSQASAAAEALGVLARHGRGGLTNFQRVATELLKAHPGLASIQLEPGGIVSDIAPRAGYEGVLGVNVLNDAAQRAGASQALARRALTVTGPVRLAHGEQGIVARVPVFQRTADGRESFWGFVAASMALREASRGPQLEELGRLGYDFAFFVPAPSRQKAASTLAAQGLTSLQGSVQQPVRVQNLEFRLALKPRAGWFEKADAALESLAALLFSALLAFSVGLLARGGEMEAELSALIQQVSREAAEQKQVQAESQGAQERLTKAQAELKEMRLALQKAESKAGQLQAQVDSNIRVTDETARVHAAELEQAQGALREAQHKLAQVQARLDAANQAQSEAALATREQLQQSQAAKAELARQLESATLAGRQAAEANAARLVQLEQSHRELQARLLGAERAQARVAELSEQLQHAREELKLRQEASTAGPGGIPVRSGEATPLGNASEGQGERRLPEKATSAPGPAAHATAEAGEGPAVVPGGQLAATMAALPGSPSAPSASSEPKDAPPAPAAEKVAVEPASPAVASAANKRARGAKKARPDDQLQLFENKAAAIPAATPSAVSRPARVPQEAKGESPGIETAARPEAPLPAVPDTPNGQVRSQTRLPQEPEEPPAREPDPGDMGSGRAAPELQGIEGVATEEGLAHADGDASRYREALRQFLEEHAGAAESIQEALVRGDLPGAQRLVHALKTAADKIGATSVRKTATVLAQACHEPADPDRIESVWAELEKELHELRAALKPVVLSQPEKQALPRRRRAGPAVDPALLRKAVNQLVPLLAEADPGAKDCLKDNRKLFRAAFAPEGYENFEQLLRQGDSQGALEQLKKAARKHGISL